MSSLHQDRPLAEDSAPAKGTRRIPAPAQGKTRTPAAATGEKAPDNVPTPRSGKARSTTSQTTPARRAPRTAGTTGTPAKSTAGRRKAATAKVAKAATAKVATAKAATAKVATAKVATAKVATVKAAKAAATKAAAVQKAAPKAAPKSTARETPAAKPAVESAPIEAPVAKRPRPTPYTRPVVVEAPFALVADVAAADLVQSAETQAREVVAEAVPAAVLSETAVEQVDPDALVAEVADERRGPFFRRRPLTLRRRPALFLAAALVGALGVSLTAGEQRPAQAETATVSHSVSVAEELGIEIEAQPIEEITPEAATERLGELAASRTERDQEQARAALIQARANRAAAEAAAAAAAEAARPDAVLPVQGARLTSGFGPRWGTLHAGIDLAAPMMTPEYAVMDGIVLEAGPASGFGNAVYIQHENGDVTVYGHMEQILVSAGQVVTAGQTIALLGNRGQSTGPHLHFEVHVGGIDGTKIDPIPWLRERGVDI